MAAVAKRESRSKAKGYKAESGDLGNEHIQKNDTHSFSYKKEID